MRWELPCSCRRGSGMNETPGFAVFFQEQAMNHSCIGDLNIPGNSKEVCGQRLRRADVFGRCSYRPT